MNDGHGSLLLDRLADGNHELDRGVALASAADDAWHIDSLDHARSVAPDHVVTAGGQAVRARLLTIVVQRSVRVHAVEDPTPAAADLLEGRGQLD